jgi:chemotaxis protein methyltransferase CheR
VTFDVANLFERHQGGVAGPWDVVFCRNVIMYFTDEQAHAAVTRLARSLTPGGYLFLGHAETLRNRSADFELCHTHGAFYYQRRPAAPSHIAVPRADPTNAAPELEAAWYEDIHAASERVRALVDVALDPAQARRASDERTAAQANLDDRAATPANLDEIRELLVEERFSEALAALDRRIAARSVSTGTAHHADRDTAMLRALVLTHSGRFPEARAACADLLAIDATSAGANYLLALCCDSTGDPDGAAQHAQIAAKLDPSFAMPRVHLGLLARRAGDRDLAARELTRAIDLLEREPPARLALYGGGFSRQALLGMCRAELTAIGASR